MQTATMIDLRRLKVNLVRQERREYLNNLPVDTPVRTADLMSDVGPLCIKIGGNV